MSLHPPRYLVSSSSTPAADLEGSAIQHAVVLATQGERDERLLWALESVANQSIRADHVLIVVDAKGDARLGRIKTLVRKKAASLAARVIPNDRTRGASGAWNTALDQLARRPDRARIVVSFLDDDDTWEPDHLAAVLETFLRGAEVTATPIVRHEGSISTPKVIAPPGEIAVSDFLVGNPGIQGSNLSVRLTTLLQAGLFDEALPSCTDRDVCIRLADLGARYLPAHGGRVHYDATSTIPRLSRRGSPSKLGGLTQFYRKYRFRMNDEEARAFEERACGLFDWTKPPPARVTRPAPRVAQTSDLVCFVTGIIVDGACPERALPLIADLARLGEHPRVDRLEVVLLQNGSDEGFATVDDAARAAGLRVWPVRQADLQSVEADIRIAPDERQGKMSIAVARSYLHRFSYEVARACERPVVWIVDDDIRLPASLDLLVDDVVRAREAGWDAVSGVVEGAPPIPAASTLRTQGVDLLHFLLGAARRDPSSAPPDAASANAFYIEGRRDYYYDLVRSQTDRLESPFFPNTSETTLGGAVRSVALRASRLLAGDPIFRPVEGLVGDPITSAKDSSIRGGHSFVFAIDLLRDVPNLSPRLAGRRLRRSDMLWASLCRLSRGKTIKVAPIIVRQDRSREAPEVSLLEKLFDDIAGYAFFRAFDERKTLDEAARTSVLRRARKLARERAAEFRLSCFRIRGVARALRKALLGESLSSLVGPAGKAQIEHLVVSLDEQLSEETTEAFIARVACAFDDPGIDAYFETIAGVERGEKAPHGPAWQTLRENGRAERAVMTVRERLGWAGGELCGMGSEGVLVKQGDRVAKVFDGWSRRERGAHLGTLRDLVEHPAHGGLPLLLAVDDRQGPLLVEMTFEEGRPYSGGDGAAMVQLLEAMHASGWAHTNLHPKNLLETDRGLRLCDVGRSVVRETPELLDQMARRGLLSLRYAGSQGLCALLRRSVGDARLPELDGHSHLLEAVQLGSPKRRLDDAIAARLKQRGPLSVLDFGCGFPRRHRGPAFDHELSVFDPDPQALDAWREAPMRVSILDETALARALDGGTKFDCVVCSLVLCAVSDDEVERVMARLRRLVAPRGRLLLSLCDPDGMKTLRTARHERFVAPHQNPDEHFRYSKKVRSGGCRTEYHRPLCFYEERVRSAGFRIDESYRIPGLDVDTFQPAPEFLGFDLTPSGGEGERP